MSGISEVQQADYSKQVTHMKAVGRGVEAAVYCLSTGLEQPRELVLRCVFWERILHNAAFIQRKEQSVKQSRRTMNVRPAYEGNALSRWQNTGFMARYIAATPHHGRRHVGQCDKNTEEPRNVDSLAERPLLLWFSQTAQCQCQGHLVAKMSHDAVFTVCQFKL